MPYSEEELQEINEFAEFICPEEEDDEEDCCFDYMDED